jgi:hypothetical protein
MNLSPSLAQLDLTDPECLPRFLFLDVDLVIWGSGETQEEAFENTLGNAQGEILDLYNQEEGFEYRLCQAQVVIS